MTARQRRRLDSLITHKREAARQRYAARCARLADLTIKEVGDLADSAKQNQTFNLNITLEEHDLEELRGLEAAQRRVGRDDFGRCQHCGAPIELPRLLVLPEAELCFACAVEQERRGARQPTTHGGLS